MYRESIPDISQDDRYSGFRALWLKVIIRAVFDYVTYKDCSKLEKKKIADAAGFWLFKPNACFNSFDNICKMLDLDADTIRHRASSMSRADVAKIEHLERVGLIGEVEMVHRGGAVCYMPIQQERVDDEVA